MSFCSRTDPPSPPSPRTGSQKDHQPGYPPDHIPQTPTSPPLLMSISAQNYAASFTSSQTSPPSQATSHSQGPNLASPPPSSSTPMSTQPSQQQTVATTNSFPTPASSVNGYLVGSASAEEPEHASKPLSVETRHAQAIARPDGTMDPSHQAEHRRTDHERQFAHGDYITDSDPVKRVSAGDVMDVDEGTVPSPGKRDAQLESLQKEFSSPFHLCRGCKGSLFSDRFDSLPVSCRCCCHDSVSLFATTSTG